MILMHRRRRGNATAENRAYRRLRVRLSGRWRASQQSRYGLLDDRLHCIFIHRHLWGERPLLPPTGSSATSTAPDLSHAEGSNPALQSVSRVDRLMGRPVTESKPSLRGPARVPAVRRGAWVTGHTGWCRTELGALGAFRQMVSPRHHGDGRPERAMRARHRARRQARSRASAAGVLIYWAAGCGGRAGRGGPGRGT